jgi:hypothetical protein
MIDKEKFQRWVNDLEDRLAAYMFQQNPKLDWPEKRLIQVCEQESGVWEVFLNGRKMYHFDGPDAQDKANQAASDLANG